MSGKLLFLATEDWFVRSHFLPLVRRAREEGYDVAVAARNSGADLDGVRLIDMPFARGSLQLGDLAREVAGVRTLIAREKPDLVHAIALKPIALSLLAGVSAPRVFAVTGRGYLGARRARWTGFTSAALAAAVRNAVARDAAMLLVENASDRAWVEGGRALADARVIQMPGAGVDTQLYAAVAEPDAGPIIVGVAARLVRSKGVDLAVEAVKALRGAGLDIVLRIAGAPDSDNPGTVSTEELARWRQSEGVELLGRVGDINGFWARAHIACLPSRGGEGLPRSLLEAAACGRPIVTTAIPGCADFATPEIGLTCPPEDPEALAEALRQLATQQDRRQAMGAAARRKVIAGYTEQHAAECAARAWRLVRGAGAAG